MPELVDLPTKLDVRESILFLRNVTMVVMDWCFFFFFFLKREESRSDGDTQGHIIYRWKDKGSGTGV